jgi:magnesium chelatase subunit I
LNLLSTAERRALKSGLTKQLCDYLILWVIPAITGKVELVLKRGAGGAAAVAQHLLGDSYFSSYFPKLKTRKKVKKRPTQISSNGFVESGFN